MTTLMTLLLYAAAFSTLFALTFAGLFVVSKDFRDEFLKELKG